MKMSMGLDMDMDMDMRQTLRQEMLQALKACVNTINDLRSDIGLDELQAAKVVFTLASELLQGNTLPAKQKAAVEQELGNQHLQAFLLDFSGDVLKVIDKAVVQGSFDSIAQEYVIDILEKDSEGYSLHPTSPTHIRAPKNQVIDALAKREETLKCIKQYKDLARDMHKEGANSSRVVSELSGFTNALQIADAIRPWVQNYSAFLFYAFVCIKDGDGRRILPHFFREIDLQRKLNWQVSENIVDRFVKRISGLKINQSPRHYEDAMMNTIGEFVLVSLGIVGPDLYTRHSGKLEELNVLSFDQSADDLSNGKISVVDQMKKLGLIQSGVFFWARWAIPGVRVTAKTDGDVRKFLRDTIIRQKEETLKALGFEEFVQALKEAKDDANDPEEQTVSYGTLLLERLTEEKFRSYLKEQCVTVWYPALKQFFTAQNR